MNISASFPKKLQFLFEPHRYKVARGGRGGGKSWGFARALLIQGIQRPLRILCTREVQLSIKQSVHRLLKDQITMLGLDPYYDVRDTSIRGYNGTEFSFVGLSSLTVDTIKSYEGFDICWVEEGQVISKESWKILIPTLRKDGSEIWVSYNPDLDTDETHQRFVIHPPEDCVNVEINWNDNPWFNETLNKERLHCLKNDPEAYPNIWEGKPKVAVEGAYYATELMNAMSEGRIGKVALESLPVHTAWDLGIGDMMAIWFFQLVGREIHLVDYYEDSGEGLAFYAKVLQDRGYLYGKHFAPHDIEQRELGSGLSRKARGLELGIKFITIPRGRVEDGIEAVRQIFSRCWFDEKCKQGVNCLRNYKKEWDAKNRVMKLIPKHNWASHGSDAFRMLAVAVKTQSFESTYLDIEIGSESTITSGWSR